MEVHAHSHTPRKKWIHYLWEFLMLFLAVFCGFLAEYQLEHKIEKERVKKLMNDMVENLKYDTTRVSRNAPDNSQLKINLDSLRFEIKESLQGKGNINRLYYFALKSDQFGVSTFNKAAITQLKSSGLLRLVRNKQLVNDILDYYERKVPGSEDYEEEVTKALQTFSGHSIVVFKTTFFDFIKDASDSAWNPSIGDKYNANLSSILEAKNVTLLSNDPHDLEKLHSAALKFEWSIINYNRFLHFARESAEKLIAEIDKDY